MIAKSKSAKLPDIATLTKAEAKVEHKRLTLEIERHDKAYYQEDAPKVSDAEYDTLRQRFNAIEARFPEFVSAESPSQKIGAAPIFCDGDSALINSGNRASMPLNRWRKPS